MPHTDRVVMAILGFPLVSEVKGRVGVALSWILILNQSFSMPRSAVPTSEELPVPKVSANIPSGKPGFSQR